jgi:transposase
MQLQTILNRVEYFKSFVYETAKWVEEADRPTIEVEIEARKNGRPVCSGCGRAGPGYDRLPQRRFEFVPLWGIAVYFVYAMRRVACPGCGVKVEQVPWCDGKNQLTTTYRWFLAGWAKRLSWKGVARAFHTSWQNVFRSVKHAVSWGLAHRDMKGIEAIGVDEIQWQRGHKYLTLVYQIDEDCRRLLWAGKDRTAKTLLRFFRMLGTARSARLGFVCSDMWKPYLKVIAKKAPQAIHVLDRFHIMAKMNKAIDEVRAAEAKRLDRDGYEPVRKAPFRRGL